MVMKALQSCHHSKAIVSLPFFKLYKIELFFVPDLQNSAILIIPDCVQPPPHVAELPSVAPSTMDCKIDGPKAPPKTLRNKVCKR